MIRRWLARGLPLLLLVLAGVPSSPAVAAEAEAVAPLPPTPAIGVLLPLTGRFAPYGQLVLRGIELARATTPAANGVRFLYHDTAGDGATAERLIDEFAGNPEVLAAIGPLTSGEAPQATARAAARDLPLLLLAPRDGTTGSARGVFRLALTAEAQVQAVAGHAVQALGLRRFAVLAPANRQGERYAELFQAEIERLGGRLVIRHSYAPEAVDLREDLQKLAKALHAAGGAEALFLPDDPRQIGQIAPQLGFARLDQLQLLGIASWRTPELTRLAGPNLEGALLADRFCPDRALPPVATFMAAFRSRYGSDPTSFDAFGFDSASLLLTTLTNPAVHERAKLAQALAAGLDYTGATGAIRFAPDGELSPPLCLLQVQGGAFVVLN